MRRGEAGHQFGQRGLQAEELELVVPQVELHLAVGLDDVRQQLLHLRAAVAHRLVVGRDVLAEQRQVHGQRRHRRAQAVVQLARQQAAFLVPAGGKVAQHLGEFSGAVRARRRACGSGQVGPEMCRFGHRRLG
ncbi:hypothetical protein D9M71_775480 [compost metagenome]